jgi:hypothetical protein
MRTKGLLRLRLIMAAGFILGALLFFKTFAGYRYVTGHLILDHLAGEAGSFVSELEGIVRTLDPADADELEAVLSKFVSESTPQVAWVAIADRNGHVVASSAGRPGGDLDPAVVAGIYEVQARGSSRLETRGGEEVLAAILPFRYRLRSDRQGPIVQSPGVGTPRFMLAEIVLSTTGAASPYLPLRRNFVIGITASIALLVAMAAFWIRLQSYLRGLRLAEQEEFGEDRLVAVAREAPVGSSAELLSYLFQVIRTFAASGELADDCTALAIRFRRL